MKWQDLNEDSDVITREPVQRRASDNVKRRDSKRDKKYQDQGRKAARRVLYCQKRQSCGEETLSGRGTND